MNHSIIGEYLIILFLFLFSPKNSKNQESLLADHEQMALSASGLSVFTLSWIMLLLLVSLLLNKIRKINQIKLKKKLISSLVLKNWNIKLKHCSKTLWSVITNFLWNNPITNGITLAKFSEIQKPNNYLHILIFGIIIMHLKFGR